MHPRYEEYIAPRPARRTAGDARSRYGYMGRACGSDAGPHGNGGLRVVAASLGVPQQRIDRLRQLSRTGFSPSGAKTAALLGLLLCVFPATALRTQCPDG
jgi:hypothetical protein